jgi:hypothetical protein
MTGPTITGRTTAEWRAALPGPLVRAGESRPSGMVLDVEGVHGGT